MLDYAQRWPDGEEHLARKELPSPLSIAFSSSSRHTTVRAGGTEKAVTKDKFLKLHHFQQPAIHVSRFSVQIILWSHLALGYQKLTVCLWGRVCSKNCHGRRSDRKVVQVQWFQSQQILESFPNSVKHSLYLEVPKFWAVTEIPINKGSEPPAI